MIECRGVDLAYGDVDVLDGVDLDVDRGEFVGLVGPNGAGKTTLLRTINGVLSPDAGEVVLGEEPVTGLSAREVARRVATVPQDTEIRFGFTAEEVVRMGRTPHQSRLDWAPESEPVEAALEATETTDLRDRRIDELSGGERQRVVLARALAQDAPALVLDEPTASLDVNHQVRVLDLVRTAVDEGRAAVAAIHDLDLAARYCDRLVLLANCAIRSEGSPRSVLEDPSLGAAFETDTALADNPVTGTPHVAAVTRGEERGVTVHVRGRGKAAARALGSCWRAGFDVTLGVVPEGDVAARAAESLDAPAVAVPPFDAPSSAARDRAGDLASAADVCLQVGPEPPEPAVDSETPVVERSPAAVADGSAGARAPDPAVDAVLAGLERQPTSADD